MSTFIAVVRFPDGQVMYALYYSTDQLGQALFATADDARASLAAGDDVDAPSQLPDDSEQVTVHPYELYGNPGVLFETQASRRHFWITGRTSAAPASQ